MQLIRRVFTLVCCAAAGLPVMAPAAHATVPEVGNAVTVADVTVTEGAAGTTRLATFTLKVASLGLGKKVTVQTTNGTATASKDYVALAPTQVSFNALGQVSVSITVKGDDSPEAHETFNLALSNPIGVTIPDRVAVATITDDDPRRVTVTGGSVTEDAVPLPFTLTLNQPAFGNESIQVATVTGTATGSDFTPIASKLVTFAAGATSATVDVQIKEDSIDEVDEQFTLGLGAATNLTKANNSATGTIVDDEIPPVTPTISIADASTTEGNSGTKSLTFVAQLSEPSAAAKSVAIQTAQGTAFNGSDFQQVNGVVLTFPAGTTTKAVDIAIKGDTVPEADETFTLTLVPISGSVIAGDNVATGTILNDDAAPVISVTDLTVDEPNSGFVNATVMVSLDRPAPSGVVFRFTTSNLTAVTPSDYAPKNALFTFPVGSTSINVPVAIAADVVDENDERFAITLSELVGLLPGDLDATVTIVDNDGPSLPHVDSFTAPTIVEGNSGTRQMQFVVTLNAPVTAPLSMPITFSGTATNILDYSTTADAVEFSAGQSSATFTVNVIGDTIDESDETVVATVTDAGGQASGVGTITDDDTSGGGGLRITSISNPTIVEGNSGTKALNFTVTLSGPATGTESFKISTANGTATAGSDYVARTNATITIPAGNSQRNVTITINGDTLDEPDETLLLNIISAIGLTVDDNQATGIITDND